MKHAAVLAVLIAGLLALTRGKIDTEPYGYDEADYMFAATLGPVTNWMDIGTLPITDFVRLGLNRGTDPGQRLALSQMARSSRDPVVYRHWHGPLYYYWLGLIAPWRGDELTVRRFNLLFGILAAIVIYFGTLRLLPQPAAQPAATLAAAFLLWGQMTVKTTELAPHMLFVLCYLPALLLLGKIMSGGDRRHWYGAVALTGLAFCTLEVTFVLIGTLVVCAYLRRKELVFDWKLARDSVALLLAAILVMWPAAILKLSALKAYFFMAYLAIFRKGAWGNITLAESWAMHFARSPLEWAAAAIALIIFFRKRLWRSVPELVPLAVYSLLMMLVLVRVHGEGPRYITTFFPALILFTSWTLGWVLAERKSLPGAWIAGALGILLFFITFQQMKSYRSQTDPYARAVLAEIRQRGVADKTLLVPQLMVPTLHYYFPESTLHGYLESSEIPQALGAGHFAAVLYPGYPVRLETPSQ